jgi:hypothetical protein
MIFFSIISKNTHAIKDFFKNKLNLASLFFMVLLFANSSLFILNRSVWIKVFRVSNSPASFSDFFVFLYAVSFFLIAIFCATAFKKASFFEKIKKIFFIFTPSQLVLIWGIEHVICDTPKPICTSLNFLLPLITVVYVLTIAYLLIFWKRDNPKIDFKKLKINWISALRSKARMPKPFPAIILILIFAINFSLGFYSLSNYAAVDEPLWTFDRIPTFWQDVSEGKWRKTNVSDKPGVTVAIISGAGLFFINPADYEPIRWQGQIYNNKQDVQKLNLYLRFPIFIFCSLSIFGFYFLIKKLLGKSAAIVASIFIGLSPILLGISKIINPDSLLWVFTSFSILCYLIYFKDQKKSHLYWSGVLLGLAILTKYIANILYVFFFIMIFTEYILNYSKYETDGAANYLKKHLSDYFILILISLLTFFILLPASWVEFSTILKSTIFSQAFQKVKYIFLGIIGIVLLDLYFFKSRFLPWIFSQAIKIRKVLWSLVFLIFVSSMIFVVLNVYLDMRWLNFESILASPKTAYQVTGILGLYLANFYSMVFGIIPLALLSILFLGSRELIRPTKKSEFSLAVLFHLIFFILLYYLASAINNVSATVRYQIIIYPLIFILSAMIFSEFFKKAYPKNSYAKPIFYFALICLSFFSLLSIKPFYFSYASDLLPKKYTLNLKDMGDGSYEAAQYLNSLPDSPSLSIWTDKKGVCSFFQGKCYIGTDFDKENRIEFDYFVISSSRENRTTNMNLNHLSAGLSYLKIYPLYNSENWNYKLEIGGRPNDFVKIFSAERVEFVQ